MAAVCGVLGGAEEAADPRNVPCRARVVRAEVLRCQGLGVGLACCGTVDCLTEKS